LVALLCAGAVSPVVAVVAGAGGAALVAGMGVLGSVGANVLTDVVTQAIDGLRERERAPTREEIETALAARLESALTAGDASAEILRREVAALLREVDGAGALLQAVVDADDRETQEQLVGMLAALGADFADFRFLLGDLWTAAGAILDTLLRQDAEHRADRDRGRQQVTQLRLLRDEVAVIERRTRLTTAERSLGPDGVKPTTVWLDRCPYRGLWPFEEDDAEVFYGREWLTAELIASIAERLTGPSLVVVTGASGGGKSSLLRAGLMPAVARGSLTQAAADWPRVVLTPTAAPLHELATHLAALGAIDPILVRRELTEHPERAHLVVREAVLSATPRERQDGRVPGAVGRRLLLVVDQFEEVFTLVDEDPTQTDRFITALHAAAGTPCGPHNEPPAVVVLGVRGDFWERCAAYPPLAAALQNGPFLVGPMEEGDLRRAITGPAAAADLDIEPGLVDGILAELRDPGGGDSYPAGSLPLVSQAMLVTWENREGRRLTSRGYAQAGGVRHAIQVSADAIYDTLTPSQKAFARELFQRMVIVVRDGPPARRPVPRAELYAGSPAEQRSSLEAVIEAFAAQRLLLLTSSGAEIAHDALLHAWPRLRDWLEPDYDQRVLHNQLLDDADEWDGNGRDRSYLYRGARLAAVEEADRRWKTEPGRYPALGTAAREFLEDSRRNARISARIRQATMIVLTVLLVIALAAAGVAIQSAGIADRQRADALSRQFAAQSELLRPIPVLHNVWQRPRGAPRPQRRRATQSSPLWLIHNVRSFLAKRMPSALWLSARMARPWPPPARMGPSDCGTP
jgi:hypothetical protein